jgi:maltose alpha-D-glucosyltransferase/alpha-amylase
MLGNDPKRIRMAYSLLLSLPSTPVIRYGDELGMGDDLSLNERLSVRTPMQWDQSQNAGFSTSDTMVRPTIDEEPFDYIHLNVKDEAADTSSLLNWTKKMIQLRKDLPAVSLGSWKIVDTNTEHVLAILYTYGTAHVLIVNNLSNNQQHVKLRIKLPKERFDFELPGYGYRWMKLSE